MKKIALISDTHGILLNSVLDFLSDSDEIWHAGDIGNINVLEELEKLKPLRAVYGNIDNHEIRIRVPEIQFFEMEKHKVLMTHIGGYPGRYENKIYNEILLKKPNLFISGHSHILKIMQDKKHNFLHINPGAAGTNGFHLFITAVKFILDNGKIHDVFVFEQKRNHC